MLQGLTVRKGQTYEQARAAFDSDLGMSQWLVPGRQPKPPAPRDPGAPWWWHGDEDASDSFLAAMGVTLDG